MEEFEERYRELMHRGVCAHAALAHVVSYSYMRSREEGLSLDQAHVRAGEIISEIKRKWEEA